MSEQDRRGTLIALEPRIRAAFHPLYHEIARRRDLTPGAKLVYAVLCSYHQMFDRVFPGRDRLAADTGISKRQLTEHMRTLVECKLLSMERPGLGLTNTYTLLKWPDEGSAETAPPSDGTRATGAETPASPIPIEEEGEQKKAGHPEPEGAATIWAAALDQLRGYPATTRNMLAELPVSLDGAVLVVRCPPEIAAQWGPYVKRALGGRAVRFVSG